MRLVALLLGCSLLALLAWWFCAQEDTAPLRPMAARPAAGTEPPAPRTTGDRLAVPETNERDAAETAPAEQSFVLLGRCVAARDGSPVANAYLAAWVDEPDESRTRDRGEASPMASCTTAADGRFAIRAPTTPSLLVRIDAPGFARLSGRWRAVQAGETDVGDVPLRAATRVEGEVVDPRGTPVEGAEVMLAVVTADGPGFAPARFSRTESGADGRYRFPEPIAAGDWYAIVNNTGGLIAPRDVHVPAGVDRHFVRITVTAPDPATAIRGIVVDDQGAPLPKIDLRGNGDGATGSARTGAEGTFVMQRGGAFTDNGDGVSLFVTDPGGEHELAADPPRVRWGAADVRIVLRRFAATTLVVTDRSGAPIADHDAFVLRDSAGYAAPRVLAARGRTDGRVPVTKLKSGRYRAIVRPLDGAPPTAPVAFSVDQGRAPAEVHVVVEPPVGLTVEVVDGNAGPVAGSGVEAILVLANRPPSVTADLPSLATARVADLQQQTGLVIAAATTGADGRASLPLHAGEYHLRIRGTLHAPVLQATTVGNAASSLRVVVESGGRILGTCSSPEALTKLRTLAADSPERLAIVALSNGDTGARAEIAADGTFTLEGLRAGKWSLQLLAPMRCNPEHAGVVPLVLGDVDVTTGTLERTFAVDALLPGIASGIVTLDGAPWPRAQLFFHRQAKPTPIRAIADAAGHFRTLLPPGDYLASVAHAAQPGPGWIVVGLPLRWSTTAGREEHLVLAARTRSVRIRVRDGSGAVIANTRVRIAGGSGYYYRPGALATDGDGWVTVQHAPYGTFDLFVAVGSGEVRCGPAELPADVDSATLEVRPRER